MLQDVPVRYPRWRLEHETRDQGWRQPVGCGDCESPAKEQAHGTQPVVPSPWHPTVVPSLSAAFEAFWKWHGAGAHGARTAQPGITLPRAVHDGTAGLRSGTCEGHAGEGSLPGGGVGHGVALMAQHGPVGTAIASATSCCCPCV